MLILFLQFNLNIVNTYYVIRLIGMGHCSLPSRWWYFQLLAHRATELSDGILNFLGRLATLGKSEHLFNGCMTGVCMQLLDYCFDLFRSLLRLCCGCNCAIWVRNGLFRISWFKCIGSVKQNIFKSRWLGTAVAQNFRDYSAELTWVNFTPRGQIATLARTFKMGMLVQMITTALQQSFCKFWHRGDDLCGLKHRDVCLWTSHAKAAHVNADFIEIKQLQLWPCFRSQWVLRMTVTTKQTL